MLLRPRRLSQKIVGLLLAFFVVSALAIGLTLRISWQLEGVAAAINDAGSQRMRSYQIAYLMSLLMEEGAPSVEPLQRAFERFERVQHDLWLGDPARPLSPPRSAEVAASLRAVEAYWQRSVRPLIAGYLQEAAVGDRQARQLAFQDQLEGFVALINETVLAMERSYAKDTTLLRSLQVFLVLWTVLGSVALIYFFLQLVIRPVNALHTGISRMSDSDLGVRLPATTDDEFGQLARGFNRMAAHLQAVYDTLGERVEAETLNLAHRNHELRILYATTAYLSEPAPLQELCDGFLERILSAMGADGAALRLYAPDFESISLVSTFALSPDFVAAESVIACDGCRCAGTRHDEEPRVFSTETIGACPLGRFFRDGFATATVFPIVYGRQKLGVFNLYFRQNQSISEQEIRLLNTLAQHLGVAIETQRLRSREKELAVSEERNLLAQELHDSIAQGLAFLNIQAQLLQDSLKKRHLEEALQSVGRLREGIEESYEHVRELLLNFRTRAQDSDLDSAIRTVLTKFERQTGIETEFERLGSGAVLSGADTLQIMHIVQEALSNVRKHAAASSVRLTLLRDEAGITLSVCDDGKGFDPIREPKARSGRHVGLSIMSERAGRIGGECRIESAPGRGTTVTVSLPRDYREENKHAK